MTSIKQILNDVLTSKLQGIKPVVRDWGEVKISSQTPNYTGEIRFNYQREWLSNHQDTIINVDGVKIARLGTLPRPNIHVYNVGYEHHAAYRAAKVLENLLYYQFNLEVTRDEN